MKRMIMGAVLVMYGLGVFILLQHYMPPLHWFLVVPFAFFLVIPLAFGALIFADGLVDRYTK